MRHFPNRGHAAWRQTSSRADLVSISYPSVIAFSALPGGICRRGRPPVRGPGLRTARALRLPINSSRCAEPNPRALRASASPACLKFGNGQVWREVRCSRYSNHGPCPSRDRSIPGRFASCPAQVSVTACPKCLLIPSDQASVRRLASVARKVRDVSRMGDPLLTGGRQEGRATGLLRSKRLQG